MYFDVYLHSLEYKFHKKKEIVSVFLTGYVSRA